MILLFLFSLFHFYNFFKTVFLVLFIFVGFQVLKQLKRGMQQKRVIFVDMWSFKCCVCVWKWAALRECAWVVYKCLCLCIWHFCWSCCCAIIFTMTAAYRQQCWHQHHSQQQQQQQQLQHTVTNNHQSSLRIKMMTITLKNVMARGKNNKYKKKISLWRAATKNDFQLCNHSAVSNVTTEIKAKKGKAFVLWLCFRKTATKILQQHSKTTCFNFNNLHPHSQLKYYGVKKKSQKKLTHNKPARKTTSHCRRYMRS